MTFTASLAEIVKRNENGLLAAHPSWCRVPLGEVAKIQNGFPFPSSQFTREGGTPLLRIRDIISSATETYFAGEYDPSFLVKAGDIVVGMDGDFNATVWTGPQALLNQRVCKLSPDERFYRKQFLAYVLSGYLRAINSETSSVTVKHLSSNTIAQMPLPLPPISEQDRIVAEIDEQITRLDAGLASLKRIRINLKRYRAAVLKAAFEGNLTAGWRTRLTSEKPDCSLLESVLAERRANWERGPFRPPVPMQSTELVQLPSSWTWQPFDAFVTDSFYGPRFAENEYSEKGVPTIRTTDIVFGGRIVLKDPPRIDLSAEDIRKFGLRDDDLLITRTGATIGKCALYRENIGPAIPSAYLIRFRLTRMSVPPRYLLLFLMSPRGQEMLLRRSTAVAQPNVNATTIAQFAVPLPPKEEIDEIVRQTDEFLESAESTEKNVLAAESKVESLRLGILAKAFEGRLVPQDPSDEPASALLERIHAAREAEPKASASRGRWKKETQHVS